MSFETKTLFGFPVVVTDVVSKDTVVMGRMPTEEDVREHGSVEKAIEAQAKEWAMIKGLNVEE